MELKKSLQYAKRSYDCPCIINNEFAELNAELFPSVYQTIKCWNPEGPEPIQLKNWIVASPVHQGPNTTNQLAPRLTPAPLVLFSFPNPRSPADSSSVQVQPPKLGGRFSYWVIRRDFPIRLSSFSRSLQVTTFYLLLLFLEKRKRQQEQKHCNQI